MIFTELASAVTYAGVRLGITNGLPTDRTISGSSESLAGTALDLADFRQSVNGLITGGGSTSTIVGGGSLGAVNLVKDGTFSQTLGGVNTHTGNTTVNAGTLVLADNAQLKFVLGATSGTNNTLPSGTWASENVATHIGAYGSTFSVVGFTNAGSNKWTKPNGAKSYPFDETTGVLTLAQPGYAAWINGIENGVEMVIGGKPATGMDTALLPTIELVTDPVSTPAIPAGNNLLFTYRRSDLSVAGGVTSACETDTDLGGLWTTATNGASGMVILVDDNFTFTPPAATTDRVRVYVPRSANTTLFGRIDVAVP